MYIEVAVVPRSPSKSPQAALPLEGAVLRDATKPGNNLSQEACSITDDERASIRLPRHDVGEAEGFDVLEQLVELGWKAVVEMALPVWIRTRKGMRALGGGESHRGEDLSFVACRSLRERRCRGVRSGEWRGRCH